MSTGDDESDPFCCSSCTFFCALQEPNSRLKRLALAAFFDEMPYRDDEESDVLVMSALWSVAMTRPDDDELPSLGALRCMSLMIAKSVAEPAWLLRHQNVYIPYYAAHVLGSYTMRLPSLADLAGESGAVLPLLSLLRGTMTWVEQRVAVRALGHLASYDSTFPAVARHREDVVPLTMRIASTCLDTVYADFFSLEPSTRQQYQRDLLTRGLGGVEMENRKAEEWASQLQCWSLHLLSCFASKDELSHQLICRDVGFLKNLCKMWGGMVNGDSPAGVGLMRILCRSKVGRAAMAGCREAVESLCHLSRSSDDWQYMGIDCLLLLVSDPKTRPRVMELAATCLVDLAEVGSLGSRKRLGDAITKALLLDFGRRAETRVGQEAEAAIKSLWELKVGRRGREEQMTKEEVDERRWLAATKKKAGNEKFCSGNVEEAIFRYDEALELCPLRCRKERLVLYSNRAQCHLLLLDPDAAISDATRALALASPANGHARSLWRRSQAYGMKGMAKESLMDAITFVNAFVDPAKHEEGRRQTKVPYYAARMINKQMNACGLFAGVASCSKLHARDVDNDELEHGTRSFVSGFGLPTIEEEPRDVRKTKGKEQLQRRHSVYHFH